MVMFRFPQHLSQLIAQRLFAAHFHHLSIAAVAPLYEPDLQAYRSVNHCMRHCVQSADPSRRNLLTSVSIYAAASASASASASRNRSRAIADRSASSGITIGDKDYEDANVLDRL